MRLSALKELLREFFKSYFPDSSVVFANQSRSPKPETPLVVLSFGNARRPIFPVTSYIDGEVVNNYATSIPVVVDLFTNGRPVYNPSTGRNAGYEDTAEDDLLAFADFINSNHAQAWYRNVDIAILVDGEVQNLTGAINDNNYEYRARINLLVYYTQSAVSHAAILHDESLQYPDGEGGYTSEPPVETQSTTGGWETDAEQREQAVEIIPAFEPTPSGGGSQPLADETTGYFTDAEIKEIKEENE